MAMEEQNCLIPYDRHEGSLVQRFPNSSNPSNFHLAKEELPLDNIATVPRIKQGEQQLSFRACSHTWHRVADNAILNIDTDSSFMPVVAFASLLGSH